MAKQTGGDRGKGVKNLFLDKTVVIIDIETVEDRNGRVAAAVSDADTQKLLQDLNTKMDTLIELIADRLK